MDKPVKNTNSLLPMGGNPTKEQIKANLKKIIEATHEHQKDQPGQYRINIIPGTLKNMFSKQELEEMGMTVKTAPNIKEK